MIALEQKLRGVQAVAANQFEQAIRVKNKPVAAKPISIFYIGT